MPRLTKPLPSRENLLKFFVYDADSGLLFWKARDASQIPNDLARNGWNAKYSGQVASCVFRKVVAVKIDGSRFKVHRVIWKLMTGKEPDLIDHRNRNPLDNRWENLRTATNGQNCMNRAAGKR